MSGSKKDFILFYFSILLILMNFHFSGRINSVREVLLFFLQSLPDSVIFNIVGFGSTHEKLFPKSVEYNENNVKQAINLASKINCHFFFFFFKIFLSLDHMQVK